jgi:alpha-L-fucosidase
MKKIALTIVSLLLASASVTALAIEKQTPKSMDELWGESGLLTQKTSTAERGEWFSQDKYSLFIHWGLYSIPAGEWQGKTYYGISEWLMSGRMAGIEKQDYQQLASQFNPTAFDAKAWVQLAVDAGMKNIVITAKHHEGFAMYNSKQSQYDIMDATPFGRDPLKELADACKEAGIGLGFYYSQYQDWYEQGSADIPWSSSKQKNDFSAYFATKVIPQVKELLTEYGDIATVWFDTPGNMSKKHSMKLVDLVRELQPKALINSRIGNGVGDFSTLGDHSISQINHPGLWETIDTTNDSWAYAGYDKNWKSGTEIAHRLITTVARGGNYMLNVGPDGNGVIPRIAADNLRKTGEWLKDYGHTIYGATASPWGRAQVWGDITVKDNILYLHVFDWPADGQLNLSGLTTDIISARVLNSEQPSFFTELVNGDQGLVSFDKQVNGWTKFTLPAQKPQALVAVIAVELKGKAIVDSTPGIDPSLTSTLNSAFASCQGCQSKELRWMQKFGEWKYADNLMNWQADGKGTWQVDVAQAGQYLLDVEYSADDVVDFSEWFFIFSDDQLVMQALDTGERKASARQFKGRALLRYRKEVLGVVDLKAGKQTITVQPKGKVVGGGIKLKAIHLTSVSE